MTLIADLWNDYTLRTILMGTALFGITSALIGCFTFMQKQSLLGDVISHATLPGIVLASFLTKGKQPSMLLFGGTISALMGTLLMHLIIKKTTLKKDAALGIILSVFFGFGLVLLTWLQKFPDAQHGMLTKYIFGNATTLMQEDVYLIASVSLCIMLMLSIFWKECVLLAFDTAYAQHINYPTVALHSLLIVLTILCIIVGLQLVGVVLMSSFLIAPAAAARQWTTQFIHMVILAMCFGFTSSVCGTIISARCEQIPTGPMIVVVASVIVFVSLIIAPKRGVYQKIRRKFLTHKHMPECPTNWLRKRD